MKQEDEKKRNGRIRGVEHATCGMGQPKMSCGATTWWDKGSSRTLKGALSQLSQMIETQWLF